MLPSEVKEELLQYAQLERPFQILQINTAGKSLTALYVELNEKAQHEFWEHCFRSKKNFDFRTFRKTSFFTSYSFLRRHLKQLSNWLFPQEELMPEALKQAMDLRPCYDNPWGLKEPASCVKRRKLFGKRFES